MGRGTERSLERERMWRGRIVGQQTSGLTIRGYCRRHGLHESAFYFWRRELAKRDRGAFMIPSESFVPVSVVPPAPTPVSSACQSSATTVPCHSSPIEIHLTDGRRVSVSPTCDSSLLTMVLDVLGREGRSC
jgi:transposase-like protein